jgi:hypothetical protein
MSNLSTPERIHALDYINIGFTKELWAQWFAQSNIETVEELSGFKVGEYVTYTNDYGVIFKGLQIAAIAKDNVLPHCPTQDQQFYLDTDAFWSPHKLSSLSKAENCLGYFIDRKVSMLFEDMGAFYAFGSKQFEEGRKEGVKYCELLEGLVCPIENRDALLKAYEALHDEDRTKRLEVFGVERIIEYELANHECWYTGSIPKDTIEYLVEDFGATKEMIYKVYSEGWATYSD